MPLLRGTRYPNIAGDTFTPLDLKPLAYYKFNTGITVTGSGVSQWDDQSGNGYHLVQGTDANRPALQSDGSILGDGLAHFLKTATITLAQPTTIYMLGKQVTWTLNSYFLDGDLNFSGIIRQASAGSSPEIEMYAGINLGVNSDLAVDTMGVITAIFNGASSSLQVDKGTALSGNAGAASMNGITLFARGDGTARFSNYQAYELIVYSEVHDDEVMNRVIGYLAKIGKVLL